jgi:glucosamine--fructose-6-phosphate aminotransferase (isomerizing)
MTNLGKNMALEIAQQPEVFSKILASHNEIKVIANELGKHNFHTVLFAARGTSDHAALYGKYLVETQLGLASGLVSPSSFTVFGARPNYKGVLLIAVSQSGGSPDLIESARISGQCGASVLAITNNPNSALANVAQFHLDVHAGAEIAVAATKSFSAQMLVLKLLIDALSKTTDGQINDLPKVAQKISDRQGEYDEFAKNLFGINRLIVTGRGFAYPTALETALKIMETVYIDAHAFSAADLLHGPMAMVTKDHPVVLIAPDGKSFKAIKPVIERLSNETDRLLVAGGSQSIGLGSAHLDLNHGLSEQLSPLVDIIAMQNLVWRMAIAAGNDPDNPRGLKKVTETF